MYLRDHQTLIEGYNEFKRKSSTIKNWGFFNVNDNIVHGVFGEQEGLVLVITSRIKPEILEHVVHVVFKKVSKSLSGS